VLTWVGVSWRTASSSRRAHLREVDGTAPDAIAVHTCARDAWLVEGDGAGLLATPGVSTLGAGTVEVATGRAALLRLLTVAVGLDSAVQGEADVGRQVRAALGASGSPVARVLNHVLARLLRQGRLEGWVREGQGVAALALREVRDHARVGVIGAGLLGSQVARGLGTRALRYNRTPGGVVRPLDALEPADAWIVATSAPCASFRPPGPSQLLIDLGHPAQALDDPRRTSLDALLLQADALLSPGLAKHASDAVEAATDEVLARLGRRAALVRTPARSAAAERVEQHLDAAGLV